jgi:hypothetical protein
MAWSPDAPEKTQWGKDLVDKYLLLCYNILGGVDAAGSEIQSYILSRIKQY